MSIAKNRMDVLLPNEVQNFLTTLRPVSVGFEDMFSELNRMQKPNNFPPYNLVKNSDDSFAIEVALAGYDKSDVSIVVENGVLLLSSEKNEKVEENSHQFIHRGISSRSFRLEFRLAEYIEVKNASMDNGMLKIDLQRIIPEALKPKQIAIK